MNFNQDNQSSSIRFNPGREGRYSSDSSDVGTRPTGDPKSRKNFQKILGKDEDKDDEGQKKIPVTEDEQIEESGMISAEDHVLKKKKAPSSLFELSSAAKGKNASAKKTEGNPLATGTEKRESVASKTDTSQENEAIGEKEHADSAAEVESDIAAKKPKVTDDQGKLAAGASSMQPLKDKGEKNKLISHAQTGNTDVSNVNPLGINVQNSQEINLNAEKPILPPADIQSIVNKIVEKVVQIEINGQTDTIVTLKHPPLFAGSDLIVTEFDSAKGEFNLTFQNLSQAAKNLLDIRANQQSLLLALEHKGYFVHIVTTTTLVETRNPLEAAPSEGGGKGTEEQKQQRQPEKEK